MIAQQVLMGELEHDAEGGASGMTPGMATRSARARPRHPRAHLWAVGSPNPVVLTGDWHSTFVNDLKVDF